jgi:4-diphosphocytidyl-2-C-methyl-D-erythritol kinase
MTAAPLHLASPAKINLHLKILGKRDDGFHTVDTRLCPLALADEVTLTPLSPGGTGTGSTTAAIGTTVDSALTCSDSTVPLDGTNLALKALRAFEAATPHLSHRAWRIHLEKRIPHGAGLGGGSSNAATVLRGLNTFYGEPLSAAALQEVAGQLGSDVPFFLYDTVCDATGRGETLVPVEEFPWKLPVVLIKPGFGIPTPWAYQRWAASAELKGVLYASQQCPWGPMVNDLERPVFEKWVLLPTLKMWLLDQKETRAALMSGSGSTLFAIATSGPDAVQLAEKARELCGPTTWVQVTQAGTLPLPLVAVNGEFAASSAPLHTASA